MVDVQPVHLARRDEHGLLPVCCHTAYLDGQISGYAAGRAAHEADSWEQACQIINAATRSLDVKVARAKPYTTPDWAR